MGRSGLRISDLLLLTILTASCLAGCGQKGPLYLPDEAEQDRRQQPGQEQSRQSSPISVT